MEILQIFQLIVAIIIIFFLTGYLIINKFFINIGKPEKIVLSIGVSLSITILIGVFLGFLGIFNLVYSIIAYIIIIILIIIIKK